MYVLCGVLGAGVVTAFVFWQCLSQSLPSVSSSDAVHYILRYLAFPAVCLLAGIGAIGNQRFMTPGAIDGNPMPDDMRFEINRRYLQNTLEQVALATLTWIAFATVHPPQAVVLVPCLAWLFLIGRACFWIGYRLSPPARAFGMGLTAYPTAATLIWTLIGLFH
jgi:hypothetical protein